MDRKSKSSFNLDVFFLKFLESWERNIVINFESIRFCRVGFEMEVEFNSRSNNVLILFGNGMGLVLCVLDCWEAFRLVI